MITPEQGAILKIACEISSRNKRIKREARQVAEGIPAEWDRNKAYAYRSFRDRETRDGLPPTSAEAWAVGENRKNPGPKRTRPSGWTAEEYRAYLSCQWYRKKQPHLEVQTPEQWRASSAKFTPEVHKARAVWNGKSHDRKERQQAAVTRILKIAEQESRRRFA